MVTGRLDSIRVVDLLECLLECDYVSGDLEIHTSELLIDTIRVVNLLEYLLECDA